MVLQNRNLRRTRIEVILSPDYLYMRNLLIILKRSQKRAEKEPKKGTERKQAILEILAENPVLKLSLW